MNGHDQREPRDFRQHQPPEPQRPDDRLVYRPILQRLPQDSSRYPVPLTGRPERRRAWIGILLLLTAGIVVLLNLGPLRAFFATMENAGSRDPTQQIKGLAAFGITVVSILAAVRIAVDRKGRDRKD